MAKSKFQIQSPERVLKQARQYRQTFPQALELPVNGNKSMYVEKVADYNLNEIQYSIQRAQYQNTLFRKLQRVDKQNRKKISQSLLLKDSKVFQNIQKNEQKECKKHQVYNKHLHEVQKRYDQQQKKKFTTQKEEAIKLRKQLKQFYQKEALRKQQAQEKQVKVQTCYSNALQRINRIQKRNQQFAQKAQLELQMSFTRNSPDKKKSLDLLKLRSTSFDYKKNNQVYQNSQQIFKERQTQFIQKFAKNQTCSLKAFEHKDEESEKVKKRIQQKLKRDIEKWAQQKKRVDEQKAQIPQKCTSKIQKSLNSTFRNTFSTFRDSFSNWRNTGELNRSRIKEKIDRRKDQIIGNHTDITLKNKSTREVDQKMLSMKQRANKVAVDYL